MKNQRFVSANFFSFFFTWGIFLPYWIGFLTIGKGLTIVEASNIMGAGMMARSLSTFLFFPAALKHISLSRFMKWTTILSLLIMIMYFPATSFSSLLIITILFSLVYPNLLPAIESSASVLMQTERLDYGKSRSYGSIGYIIAVLLIGVSTNFWGESSILWVMIAGLTFLILTQALPAPFVLSQPPVAISKQQGNSSFRLLLTTGSFVTILIITILLQGAHTSYYNYGFLYLKDIGVSNVYIGFILNIAIVSEIIIFVIADRLMKNMMVSKMFLLAALGSTIRWVLIFLFPNVWVFILSQALHALSFGIAHFAFIQYISKNLSNHHIPAAQGMYAAFAMSLSTALLTFAGGPLYDYSPGIAFLSMSICSVLAIVIVLTTRKRYSY